MLSPSRLLLAFALTTSSIACVVPSSTLPLDGVYRDPAGAWSAGGAIAYPGDVIPAANSNSAVRPAASAGLAFMGRGTYQAARDLHLAADLGAGGVSLGSTALSSASGGALGGRFSARYNPTIDYVALVGGVFGGAEFLTTSTSFTPTMTGTTGVLGMDLGVRGGYRFIDRLELVGSQSFSLAMNMTNNASTGRVDVRGLAFSATEIGLLGRVTDSLWLGGFLSMFYGFTDQAHFGRPAFVPSVGVRYVMPGR